jgi:TolA-binding protein
LVLAVALGWFHYNKSSKPQPQLTAKIVTSPPKPSVLKLEKPAVELPPVLIWRGSGSEQEFETDLSKALEPYKIEDYATAQRELETLVARYPRSPEVHFYLGVCQLFLGQNRDAAESLQKARESARGPLANRAAWYLSLAQIHEGNRAQALGTLKKLCGVAGEYQTRACAGLHELTADGNNTSR